MVVTKCYATISHKPRHGNDLDFVQIKVLNYDSSIRRHSIIYNSLEKI